jgi:hypothetical protein
MGKEYVRKIDVQSLVNSAVEPIYIENFDWDYDVHKTGDGNYTIERDPTIHVDGRASLSMLCQETECDGKSADILLYPPTTEAKYYEIIMTFMINSEGPTYGFLEWYFELVNSNSGGSHEYRFRMDLPNNDFELEDAAGWHDVGDIPQSLVANTWYTIRFLFDMVNFRWVGIDFQGYDIDLSAYAFQSYTAVQYRNSFKFSTWSTHDQNPWGLWVDKIVIRGLDFVPL